MMFGLALIGIMGATGLAIDFTRQSNASSALQSAVDSTALTVVREIDSLNAAQISARAQTLYNAMTSNSPISGLPVVATLTTSPTKSLNVTVDSQIQSMFGGLFGISGLPVKATATIPISSKPTEIALVMDNTGSMGSRNKMTELKKAATNLINAMQTASSSSGNDIRIALVPFARSVNIGSGASSQPWLDWSSYRGRKSNWDGCVDDRDQPYDARGTKPDGDRSTWYPATSGCNLAQIMPMTNDWSGLKTRINDMRAAGTTNLPIGLAWGLNMMLPGNPLSAANPDWGKYNHFMILLTDGVNTQSRTSNNSATIDARTKEACDAVKAAGIQLFTVRVIDGNASLLRSCASNPDMFYDVSNASELSGVFDKISTTVKNAIYLQR
jgi:Mg-chelatase subunit ChlD